MSLELIYPYLEGKPREPCLKERVFFIPSLTTAVIPSLWETGIFFEKDQPICIEYCSGNGQWITAQAERYPDLNWIAVERQFDRVRKIWSKVQTKRLKNLFIVCGEAFHFSEFYIPSSAISKVFINFPDPWPKKRHHKHRVIQPSFLTQLSRILKQEGSAMFVTDDRPYLDWTLEAVARHEELTPAFPFPFYQTTLNGYGTSTFEEMWREQGKEIFYFEFLKRKS